jgi:hypothetical protein
MPKTIDDHHDCGDFLGEFRRGPARFTVHRDDPHGYLVNCDDGNGPSEVLRLTAYPGAKPQWHGPWNGDRWCKWIEAETRKVIR